MKKYTTFLLIGGVILAVLIASISIFAFAAYYFSGNPPLYFGEEFPEVINEETVSRKLGFYYMDCFVESGCYVEQAWKDNQNASAPILKKIVLDESYSVLKRKAAMEILGELEGKNSEEVFLAILRNKSSEKSLKIAAMSWLGHLESQQAREAIVSIFLNSSDFEISSIGEASYEALLNYEPDEYIARALLEASKDEKIYDSLKFRIFWILHNDYGTLSDPIRNALFEQATAALSNTSNTAISLNAALMVLIINFEEDENQKNKFLFKELLDYKNPEREIYRYPDTVEREIHLRASYILSELFPNECDMMLRYNEVGNFYTENYDNQTISHNDACIEFWRIHEFN